MEEMNKDIFTLILSYGPYDIKILRKIPASICITSCKILLKEKNPIEPSDARYILTCNIDEFNDIYTPIRKGCLRLAEYHLSEYKKCNNNRLMDTFKVAMFYTDWSRMKRIYELLDSQDLIDKRTKGIIKFWYEE